MDERTKKLTRALQEVSLKIAKEELKSRRDFFPNLETFIEGMKDAPLNVSTHAWEQGTRALDIVEKLLAIIEHELKEDPEYDNNMKAIIVTLLQVAAICIMEPTRAERTLGWLSEQAQKEMAAGAGALEKKIEKEGIVDAIFPKTGQV